MHANISKRSIDRYSVHFPISSLTKPLTECKLEEHIPGNRLIFVPARPIIHDLDDMISLLKQDPSLYPPSDPNPRPPPSSRGGGGQASKVRPGLLHQAQVQLQEHRQGRTRLLQVPAEAVVVLYFRGRSPSRGLRPRGRIRRGQDQHQAHKASISTQKRRRQP